MQLKYLIPCFAFIKGEQDDIAVNNGSLRNETK